MVIKSEGLTKIYRLGVISSRTFYQDLNRLIARARKRDDPYAKILASEFGSNRKQNYIWALKDVSFEINEGEVVGIVGRNGAGKSTLLKILSRVTSPSSGRVKIKGRVASLLEIGTGFHQELTGRENIFLNGSIHGMSRNEIRKKFDEIVDFSGVEQFIDTPVKRYSSGMYVRLAFAVAAHLEPEILIVDEVLAVGDSEFQKKCLNKLEDVSRNSSRTVLFVSHNLGAVKKLCEKSILLVEGSIKNIASSEEIVTEYLETSVTSNSSEAEFPERSGDLYFRKISIRASDSKMPVSELEVSKPFTVTFTMSIRKRVQGLSLGFSIFSGGGSKVFYSSVLINDLVNESECQGNLFTASAEIPGMFLAPGKYYINAALLLENIQLYDFVEHAVSFSIAESGSGLQRYNGKDIGVVLPRTNWNKISVSKTLHGTC